METAGNARMKRMVAKAELRAISDALLAADRMGTETDEPEGSRYIQLSDTLAIELARMIRSAAVAL